RPASVVHVFGEIEAAEAHAGLAGSRTRSSARAAGRDVVGIETVLIVDLAFLRIAQDVVGFLDSLEALFRRLVAGIEVGMILASQLTVGFANLVFFGAARYAERFVVIVFACGWHTAVVGSWLFVLSCQVLVTLLVARGKNQQRATSNQ